MRTQGYVGRNRMQNLLADWMRVSLLKQIIVFVTLHAIIAYFKLIFVLLVFETCTGVDGYLGTHEFKKVFIIQNLFSYVLNDVVVALFGLFWKIQTILELNCESNWLLNKFEQAFKYSACITTFQSNLKS